MGLISDDLARFLRGRIRLAIAICFALIAIAHARGGGGYHGGGGGGGDYGGGGGGGTTTGGDDTTTTTTEDGTEDSYNGNNGWWGYPGSGGSGNGNGNGGGFGTGGGNGGGGRNGNGGNNAGFDISSATYYRNVHGIVAMVAFIGLFPLGSILMRVLPGKLALWVHGIFQVLSLAVYIAAVGLGIHLVRIVRIPFGGGNLLTNESTRYHPIIGLVLLVLLVIQPVLGYIHHSKYKRILRRQVWSYLHIFNGRIAITVGIINGGLGLNLSNASEYRKRVYIIVAAVMWGLWMVVAIVSEIIRARRLRNAGSGSSMRSVTGARAVGTRPEKHVATGAISPDSRSARRSED